MAPTDEWKHTAFNDNKRMQWHNSGREEGTASLEMHALRTYMEDMCQEPYSTSIRMSALLAMFA